MGIRGRRDEAWMARRWPEWTGPEPLAPTRTTNAGRVFGQEVGGRVARRDGEEGGARGRRTDGTAVKGVRRRRLTRPSANDCCG